MDFHLLAPLKSIVHCLINDIARYVATLASICHIVVLFILRISKIELLTSLPVKPALIYNDISSRDDYSMTRHYSQAEKAETHIYEHLLETVVQVVS